MILTIERFLVMINTKSSLKHNTLVMIRSKDEILLIIFKCKIYIDGCLYICNQTTNISLTILVQLYTCDKVMLIFGLSMYVEVRI